MKPKKGDEIRLNDSTIRIKAKKEQEKIHMSTCEQIPIRMAFHMKDSCG